MNGVTTSQKYIQLKQLNSQSALSKANDQLSSIASFIDSDRFSIQMAVLHLYDHMRNIEVLKIIIPSLHRFSTEELADWVPIIVYIFSISRAQIIESFLHELSIRCVPLYLCIRWSFSAYVEDEDELQKHRNKLDSYYVNQISTEGMNKTMGMLSSEQIQMMVKKKEVLSNYINILNNFYCKLFKYPEKLKKTQFGYRKEQLNGYLIKLIQRFSQHFRNETQYSCGICLPFCQTINQFYNESYVLVNCVQSQTIPFSTKNRVPFKIMFQTVNFDDYNEICADIEKVRKIHPSFEGGLITKTKQEQNKQSLVLPHSYFGEDWSENLKKITIQSSYGHLLSYRVYSYIVKSGDDIRQQHMAMKLIQFFHKIFKMEHLKLWVKPYQIIPFNKQSGFIQFVQRTKTISCLKAASNQKSLRVIYKQIYGQNWQLAITNFIQSLAGYSLFQYLFQVKDRHNKNILVDAMGHIIHIDFSFMISNSPGNINFEKAPFKLTQDYVQLMEGANSDIFSHFKYLLYTGLVYLRKYKVQIMGLLDIMKECPGMKCFSYFDRKGLEKRFHESCNDKQLEDVVSQLVNQSINSYSTGNYDRYQWITNEIHS